MYNVVKLIVYITSIMLTMYSFSCFNYEKIILKGKLVQFYIAFIILSISVGYLLASFILDFMTIHF